MPDFGEARSRDYTADLVKSLLRAISETVAGRSFLLWMAKKDSWMLDSAKGFARTLPLMVNGAQCKGIVVAVWGRP